MVRAERPPTVRLTSKPDGYLPHDRSDMLRSQTEETPHGC